MAAYQGRAAPRKMSHPAGVNTRAGPLLSQARTAVGMTQAAVAAQCRVERSNISHTEHDRTIPERRFWMAADAAVRAGGALGSAYDARHGRGFTIDAAATDLHHHLLLDLKAWIDMNRRELLSFLAAAGTLPAAAVLAGFDESERAHLGHALGGRVDEPAIGQLEAVGDVTAQQYEAFGPRAVAAIRRGQAELVETLLPDRPSRLKPRLHSVRASVTSRNRPAWLRQQAQRREPTDRSASRRKSRKSGRP